MTLNSATRKGPKNPIGLDWVCLLQNDPLTTTDYPGTTLWKKTYKFSGPVQQNISLNKQGLQEAVFKFSSKIEQSE